MEVKHLDSGEGLESEGLLVGKTFLINKFGDTAGGIAAHLGLAAVGIEHPHTKISDVGGHNRHQTIAANSEMRVAHPAREFREVLQGLACRIDIDIIVAGTMHLGEPDFLTRYTHNAQKL